MHLLYGAAEVRRPQLESSKPASDRDGRGQRKGGGEGREVGPESLQIIRRHLILPWSAAEAASHSVSAGRSGTRYGRSNPVDLHSGVPMSCGSSCQSSRSAIAAPDARLRGDRGKAARHRRREELHTTHLCTMRISSGEMGFALRAVKGTSFTQIAMTPPLQSSSITEIGIRDVSANQL